MGTWHTRHAAFDEPGYVKIVWTLRADPIGPMASVFRTETRVTSTDITARKKFRWYWSFFSPGMFLIRWVSLAPLKADAERRSGVSIEMKSQGAGIAVAMFASRRVQ